VGFEFERTADFAGVGRLYVDGEQGGEGEIPRYTPARFSITNSGLICWDAGGPAVSGDYVAPFVCNAGIRRVTIDVSGTPYRDVEAEFAAIMAERGPRANGSMVGARPASTGPGRR